MNKYLYYKVCLRCGTTTKIVAAPNEGEKVICPVCGATGEFFSQDDVRDYEENFIAELVIMKYHVNYLSPHRPEFRALAYTVAGTEIDARLYRSGKTMWFDVKFNIDISDRNFTPKSAADELREAARLLESINAWRVGNSVPDGFSLELFDQNGRVVGAAGKFILD